MTGIRQKKSDSLAGLNINCQGCQSLEKLLVLQGWGGTSNISDTAETTKIKSSSFCFPQLHSSQTTCHIHTGTTFQIHSRWGM